MEKMYFGVAKWSSVITMANNCDLHLVEKCSVQSNGPSVLHTISLKEGVQLMPAVQSPPLPSLLKCAYWSTKTG
jgi:hypothetical protein